MGPVEQMGNRDCKGWFISSVNIYMYIYEVKKLHLNDDDVFCLFFQKQKRNK
jgi:hypothetical protein